MLLILQQDTHSHCCYPVCRRITTQQSSLRLTAQKSEAPPHERKGKHVSMDHFYAVQAQARKWYEWWPKDLPDDTGYAAPRLPKDEHLLRVTLRHLLGSEQVATWMFPT